MDLTLKNLVFWDKKLVQATRNFKVLKALAWPYAVQDRFLKSWHKRDPQIPKITYRKYQLREMRKELDEVARKVDTEHPLGSYIRDTARSFQEAARMLEHLGGAQMTKSATALYGAPSDRIQGSRFTSIDAAEHFITTADEFAHQFDHNDYDLIYTAEQVKRELEERIERFFRHHEISVEVTAGLASKAAAGTSRIRLRKGASFSVYELRQLWEHEALVHSLTGINGAEQPFLRSLRHGGPRTTATQEGLATFAELVTGVMDLPRLKRIAQRIVAIQKGLEGADFIEVFRYFLESGQSDIESYLSTMRVFRGGDPRGRGVVFTKDSVYMNGLFNTHTFLRWAMHEGKIRYSEILFCGRLTFEDVVVFAPFVNEGIIQRPQYVPPWIRNVHGLAAYLAFSLFANKIRIDRVVDPGGV